MKTEIAGMQFEDISSDDLRRMGFDPSKPEEMTALPLCDLSVIRKTLLNGSNYKQ